MLHNSLVANVPALHVQESHTVVILCPSCSTSCIAACPWLGKAVEDLQKPWLPSKWEIQRKFLAPGYRWV